MRALAHLGRAALVKDGVGLLVDKEPVEVDEGDLIDQTGGRVPSEKMLSFVNTVVHQLAAMFHGGLIRSTGTTVEPAARSCFRAISFTSGVTIVM